MYFSIFFFLFEMLNIFLVLILFRIIEINRVQLMQDSYISYSFIFVVKMFKMFLFFRKNMDLTDSSIEVHDFSLYLSIQYSYCVILATCKRRCNWAACEFATIGAF